MELHCKQPAAGAQFQDGFAGHDLEHVLYRRGSPEKLKFSDFATELPPLFPAYLQLLKESRQSNDGSAPLIEQTGAGQADLAAADTGERLSEANITLPPPFFSFMPGGIAWGSIVL